VVWAFKGQPAPLAHRLTLVEFPEGNLIADVGFGGQTPTRCVLNRTSNKSPRMAPIAWPVMVRSSGCSSVRHPDGHVEPRALADARELGTLLEEVMNLALPTPAGTIWAKVPKQPPPAQPSSLTQLVRHGSSGGRFLAKRHTCKRKGMIPRDLL
jgi:hypothetical protein